MQVFEQVFKTPRLFLPFLMWLGFQLFSSHLFAADKILDISQITQNAISLTEYFAVLEDNDKTLTLENVQKDEISARFKTNLPPSEALNYSYTHSAYWLRLHLNNSSTKPIERMLEIAYPLLESVDFYSPSQTIHTGYSKSFSARAHKSRFFVFPISIPAQENSIIYLRIETPNSMNIPVKLWEPTAFYAHERFDYSIQTLFLGIGIAMAIFNFLLFVSLKDINYFLYVATIIFYALSIAGTTGTGNEFIWGDSPQLTKFSVSGFASLGFATSLLFIQQMINTKKFIPTLDKFLKLLMLVHIMLVFFLFFTFQFVAKFTVISHIITSLFILVLLVICVLKKERTAHFFLIAFLLPTLGVGIAGMRALGILPTNIITMMGAQITSAAESLLLAFALADRYKMIRLEKENAQQLLVETLKSSEQVLETRVLERTDELKIASEKLQLLVEKEREYSIEKSHFLAMLTHELKSPLATIELAAANIQRSQNPEINALSLKHIQSAAHDMSVITQRCLQADKLEQENSTMSVITFPLEVLIHDRRLHGQWLDPNAGSRLQFDIPPQLLMTNDELSCRIILSNLVENALKYSPAQSRILISVKVNVEPAGVFISICNEIGKAGKPDAAKVFGKYYRSENAQRLRGTGLGLWLVRGIATQLGGTVNYIEHNDKVEFQLWLPQ